MWGRPPTARPWLRPPTRGRLAAARASPKGRPAVPAGRSGARKGLPPASSPTVSRGSDTSRRDGRPLVGRLPAGKGSHRLHRGSGGGGAEGERGVRASFGEKDDPAPMNSRNFEDCPHASMHI
ncbi:hypothetical protein GW17_00042877 [Ensete ventricosum]|nr:hypothetical protein GW17_00042877 [Ensete ventricosum]